MSLFQLAMIDGSPPHCLYGREKRASELNNYTLAADAAQPCPRDVNKPLLAVPCCDVIMTIASALLARHLEAMKLVAGCEDPWGFYSSYPTPLTRLAVTSDF